MTYKEWTKEVRQIVARISKMVREHNKKEKEKDQKNPRRRIVRLAVRAVLLVFLAFLIFSHPKITLKGAEKMDVGTSGFEEPGYTATDIFGRDITKKVKVEKSRDKVTYTVRGFLWKKGKVERDLYDGTPPELKLVGGDTVLLKGGTYTERGVSATDAYDGDLTDKIVISELDTSKVGTQEITYTVADHAGNVATATRTVTVKKRPAETPIVYLTFDDGPGPYTQEFLDLLEEEEVLATFFVTNAAPKYQNLIRTEAANGNVVAIHTYSHNYSQIYSSEEAFWEDNDAMNEIIEQQTGSKTTMLRFPGGASNTVSRITTGIMTQLIADCEERGYQYYDWNVSSGDAATGSYSEAIYNNVIKGMSGQKESIVLMHDTKQSTLEALPLIIQWAKDNGYEFKTLSPDGFTVHHTPNN